MNRAELFAHVAEAYGVTPEYLWESSPDAAVLRHTENPKWFGIVMSVQAKRLGLAGDGPVDVLNVKVDPADAAVLRETDGILPAYHMNKQHWISIVIEDERIPEGMLLSLLDMSYRLTL